MVKEKPSEIVISLETVIEVFSNISVTRKMLNDVVKMYESYWKIAKETFPDRRDIDLLKLDRVSWLRLMISGLRELTDHRKELVVKTKRLRDIFLHQSTQEGFSENYEELSESAKSYHMLKKLEQEIRKFLEKELSEINPKWETELIPEKVRETAIHRKTDDENRKMWTFKKQPLLSYIYFTGYEKIIILEENWDKIFNYVFHDKKAISVKLKEIEPIRNAIAHTRNLDDKEKENLRFYSQDILSNIAYYYDNKEDVKKQKELEKKEKEVVAIPISVSFDRTVYPLRSKVYLRANVPKTINGKPIIFQVLNSQNKLLVTKQINPEMYDNLELKSAGLYQTSFVMEGDDWKIGEKYHVKVIHENSEAISNTSIDARNPVIQSDKSVYLWGTDMIITVIDPDADKDSQKPEFVGDREDAKLIIKSSKGELVNYRLRETGDSTGIFQGVLGFIGMRNNGEIDPYVYKGKSFDKTQGKEVYDGYIVVSEDDKLKIIYSNSKGTAELTAFVIHVPETSSIGF